MNKKTDDIYDEWLILRCQTGDRHAIEILIARWQAALLQFAAVVTRDPELARDAVQDTWISVLRHVATLQDPARFRAWLFRIAHNKCMDTLRRRGQVREARDTDQRIGSPVAAIDDSKTVNAVLGRLREDYRAVLALHYLYEMDVAEIADLLDIPHGTVKSRLFHGREAFRRALEHGGNKDERSGPEDRAGAPQRYRLSWHH